MLSNQHVRSSRLVLSQVKKNVARSTFRFFVTSKVICCDIFAPIDHFQHRHMGSQGKDRQTMLDKIGFSTMEALIDSTVPSQIRLPKKLDMEPALTETEALEKLKGMMSENRVHKSFIGMGYYETNLPGVILRNVLENPGWYTAYTPYQAEIAQGRLESLLNFQTMVTDLTALPLSNASLLDEATAAAEAMAMCYSLKNGKKKKFFVDERCHPQNIALVKTRGTVLGIDVVIGSTEEALKEVTSKLYCGVLAQYPDTFGTVSDWSDFTKACHTADNTLVIAATDLMASVVCKPAGEMGFDIAVGSAQRFGVPMGFGGPHAAFLATTDTYSRKMPGRIIGVSIDSRGKPALRMAMQTREQHIRRDKATSNICTAQALLANMAAFYAVYHGPDGLKRIAERIHFMAQSSAYALADHGFKIDTFSFFDTFVVDVSSKGLKSSDVQAKCADVGINVRVIDGHKIGVSFGEAIKRVDVESLLGAFGVSNTSLGTERPSSGIPTDLHRSSSYLTHPVFNSYRSETQMLRYMKGLENKDLSLNYSAIMLGSCTMKLNASVEMFPVTWPETCNMHPFAPEDQTRGYKALIDSLNADLAEITGFAAVSTQPNSGATGEFAGLLCIDGYHKSRGDNQRDVCLIPVSAHGTNPASASMCGLQVVVIKTEDNGNINLNDLKEKIDKYKERLSALMVTYPSTYGVFEEEIKTICDMVHDAGGQVYMDGANMNAQVALTSPGFIGADVCHLNLHKTFCIPHGGGGPGVGSIGVAKHLAPFLPGHPVVEVGGEGENTVKKSTGAIAAAPFGSAAILPISWMYIKMLGESGLREATGMAILNANYMANRIEAGYDILFKGTNGQCAHEFIMDLRPFKEHGVVEEDVAKRLQDYGFHSPTMSWPVGGTLMVEPTESEDKAELDRLCDAFLMIRKEIEDVVSGKISIADSPLKGAPHTADMVTAVDWSKSYSRECAAFPAPWLNAGNKFWPTVGRIDNVYGDRNLVCTCPPISVYETIDA